MPRIYKRKPTVAVAMATIVHDTSNAKLDKRIPATEATRLYNAGKLSRVDVGQAWAPAYMPVKA